MATPEEVAKEKLAAMQAAKEAKAKEQSSPKDEKPAGSGDGTGSSPDKEKTEDEKKADVLKQAEEKAKADAQLLTSKDEDLDEEQKKRKAELGKVKADNDEEERKKGVEARIGELTGTIKDLKRDKEANKDKIAELEATVDGLQKDANATPDDKAKEQLVAVEAERIAKYLEEDKEKDREQRREMSDEELEDWLLEDIVHAQTWLTRRELRRQEDQTVDRITVKQQKLVNAQAESQKKAFVKYPELNVCTRTKELEAEGKENKEIQKILREENPKYKICQDILLKDVKKYYLAPNGPELLVEELEKVLKANGGKPSKESKEEMEESEIAKAQAALEEAKAEIARLQDVDNPAGSGGAGKGTGAGEHDGFESALQKEGFEMYHKATGKSKEDYLKNLARSAGIPG